MTPLHRDSHYTFRFTDNRIIPRFHLEGVETGRRVSVFRLDPDTGERLGLLTTGLAGDGGWVDVKEPIIVRAGDAFIAVQENELAANHETSGVESAAVTTGDHVRLRPVEPCDLPRMYDLQLDPDSNRMAVTIPRTREAFDSHWVKSLDDPSNTARAILVDDVFVGYISCFPSDGQDHVGYWIDRADWGKGIASRALLLLLQEVTKRPLIATAATSNGASLRVLQKCGFVVEQVRLDPATDRYPECEVAVHVLR
jgi:RimJ/RimL family protein N-acetyltransferase